jgi:hypothetical protein
MVTRMLMVVLGVVSAVVMTVVWMQGSLGQLQILTDTNLVWIGNVISSGNLIDLIVNVMRRGIGRQLAAGDIAQGVALFDMIFLGGAVTFELLMQLHAGQSGAALFGMQTKLAGGIEGIGPMSVSVEGGRLVVCTGAGCGGFIGCVSLSRWLVGGRSIFVQLSDHQITRHRLQLLLANSFEASREQLVIRKGISL